MSQPAPSKSLSKPITVGLILITVLSLAAAGYTTLNPHVATVTQQQFLTNTQNVYNTQTATSIGTVTNVKTVTNAAPARLPGDYYQYCNYYSCFPYAALPGYTNFGCYGTGATDGGAGNTAKCSGYLYKDANGCLDLLVPVNDGFTDQSQEYFYLQNLPSSYPSIGSWVTVTGQVYQQGNFPAPNGGACPTSYIQVTSIS